MSKIGLVLEGGAFRGIFTAGVLDYLQEQNISFPYVIGVSAGAGNATSFVSKQKGRIKRVITHENADPYYGFGQIFRTGKFFDIDIMTYEYSYKQIPFDFETFFSSPVECDFVVTNCYTGEVEYLNAEGDEKRLLELTKASCSLPMISKPVEIDSQAYLDGSLIDSVPAEYSLKNKCDKVVVILTRDWQEEPPTDYTKFRPFIKMRYNSHYPKLVDVMMKRKQNYEKQMKKLDDFERSGLAYVIRPENMKIGHFEKDMEKVNAYYQHGKDVMERHLDELRDFMGA